jgi:cytochrome c biogenesis protein CcmG, thiol:disulfide interchange protein DsbE
MRRLPWILGVLVLTAIVVIGLRQAGGSGSDSDTLPPLALNDMLHSLQGAPPALASLYAQPNELLGGGKKAFDARLEELKGHPLVVNKWASWCAPCRAEFPVFERQAAKQGKKVGFLAVNGTDKAPAAKKFLAKFPLPYPSYEDPKESIARHINAPKNYPTTVFIDANGRTAFIHAGEYKSEDQLAADIDKYLR